MQKSTDLSRQKLVPIFSTHDELEARMIQDLLRGSGIESMINGEMLPSLYPVNMGDMAERQVLVLESDTKKAGEIIAAQHEAGLEEGE